MARIERLLSPLAGGFDDPGVRKRYIIGLSLILFLFPFGLVFIVGGLLPAQYAWTASIIIILNGLVTFVSEVRSGPPAASLLRFGLLFVLLFVVELVGVRTGYPFGSYIYTDVLRLSLLGVPIAIPFAWYSTVINTWRISEVFGPAGSTSGIVRMAAVAGILTVALDAVLEPMAAQVNFYWLWKWGIVPVQNYLSWFVLSAAAVGLLALTGRTITEDGGTVVGRRANALVLFGLQWTLFALTGLVHGHVVPALASAATLLLLWGARSRPAAALWDRRAGTP
jgi:putative membrane protein